jgi:hypothetical protein
MVCYLIPRGPRRFAFIAEEFRFAWFWTCLELPYRSMNRMCIYVCMYVCVQVVCLYHVTVTATVTVTVTDDLLNTKVLTLVSRRLSQPVQSPNYMVMYDAFMRLCVYEGG